MTINFYPNFTPWAFITRGMTAALPPGEFYIQADDMVPRSSKPTQFVLESDREDPVKIFINNQYIGTVVPVVGVMPVYINLYAPPGTNHIYVTNGVDTPVYLHVAATYMTSIWEMVAAQMYEVSGRQIERHFNLITSRFASFFIDYQLPWRQYLPEIRSLRIMAIKSMALALYTDQGTEQGITNFLSGFCHTTPVFKETRNQTLWQPDLYQTVTDGEDIYGFEDHIWMPNLCLSRWVAFTKLLANVSKMADRIQIGEDIITLAEEGTARYQTHRFDTLEAENCSVRALLEFLGCMDNITVAANVNIISDVPICAFATPFDQLVDHPGIGGAFLDSGGSFDTEPLPLPPIPPFDSIYDIDLLTDYWTGTNLRKSFDLGKCLDTYPTTGTLTADANCCMEGPDTILMTTLDCSGTVTSPITPINPIFGGGSPGLLDNPYFDELA